MGCKILAWRRSAALLLSPRGRGAGSSSAHGSLFLGGRQSLLCSCHGQNSPCSGSRFSLSPNLLCAAALCLFILCSFSLEVYFTFLYLLPSVALSMGLLSIPALCMAPAVSASNSWDGAAGSPVRLRSHAPLPPRGALAYLPFCIACKNAAKTTVTCMPFLRQAAGLLATYRKSIEHNGALFGLPAWVWFSMHIMCHYERTGLHNRHNYHGRATLWFCPLCSLLSSACCLLQ